MVDSPLTLMDEVEDKGFDRRISMLNHRLQALAQSGLAISQLGYASHKLYGPEGNAPRGSDGLLLLQRYRPDAFQRQLCPQVLIKARVLREQLIYQVVLVPEANAEEVMCRLPVD